jgi:hypothetical protein
MSKEKPYGVVCKGCGREIILGHYRTPDNRGGLISFVVAKSGTKKCPRCRKVFKYDQGDLQDFS